MLNFWEHLYWEISANNCFWSDNDSYLDVVLAGLTPVPKMAADSITSITDKITKDGSSGYKAEKGRYHLYISHGCPYAQRWGIMLFPISYSIQFKD